MEVTSVILSSLWHFEGWNFLSLLAFQERGMKRVEGCEDSSKVGASAALGREAAATSPFARRNRGVAGRRLLVAIRHAQKMGVISPGSL